MRVENYHAEFIQFQEKIHSLWKEVFNNKELTINQTFTELGGRSEQADLLYKKISSLVKDKTLRSTLAYDYFCVADMANYLWNLKENMPLQSKVHYQKSPLLDEPIAIIGMSCCYPGHANNPEHFWHLLDQGIDPVTEVPISRFDINKFFDMDRNSPGKTVSRWGGFIDDIELFDANFFGISPKEANELDPQHRILLELSWKAIEDAGIDPLSLKNSLTGIFTSATFHDYQDLLLKNHPEGNQGAYYCSGNAFSGIPGRIAYTLGLQGPSLSIDTACSSSLVALHEACNSLKTGGCNLALVGGINLILTPEATISFSQAGMLSRDGRCKTFSADANGYVRSEGAAVIVIKRLSDALADNERILAIIKGHAVNHNGKSSGMTVPNALAQEHLLKQVLANSGLETHEIDYLEAHGTGTQLGDPIEFNAIQAVFANDAKRKKDLLLGSVKTNVGHCEGASGITGVIKILLSFLHERIPRHLHFSKLNPRIDLSTIPAQIPLDSVDWPKQPGKNRCAGVSSFGATGTNAHVILEEAPKEKEREAIQPTKEQLLVLSAKSKKSLKNLIFDYTRYLTLTRESLSDICYTAAVGRSHFSWRMAIIATSKEELIEQLNHCEYPLQETTPQDGLLQSNDLKEISEAYGQGKPIDWAFYYASYQGILRKVCLPTYVFDKQRYWIEISKAKEQEQLADECFYEMLWQEQELPEKNSPYSYQGTIWLIDNGAISNEPVLGKGINLIHQTTAAIAHTTDIPPDLLGIFYYTPSGDAEEVMSYQKHYAQNFLSLAQTLAGKKEQLTNFDLGLVLVTQKAQQVRLDEAPIQTYAAPLGGMIKALQWEAPYLKARWLDVDDYESISPAVWTNHRPLFAIRCNQGYSPIVQQAILGATSDEFHRDGLHWITGGTDGLGMALTEYLVSQGVKQLLLSSRRGETEEVSQALMFLRNQGVVIEVLALDICNKKALQSLITQRGKELAAIYHLAGIEQSARFTDITPAQLDEVFLPKIGGAALLDELTRSLPLHHFVLFSSTASFFGNYHQMAYVAANQYLDALAQKRSVEGFPATVINWGPWADAGMATKMQLKMDESMLLSVKAGLAAMTGLIRSKSSAIAITRPEAVMQRLAFLPDPKPQWLGVFLRLQCEAQKAIQRSHLALDLLTLAPKLRLKRLTELASQSIVMVLGLHETPVLDKGFFDLGLDSLMSVEVVRRVQEQLGISLKPTAAFDYPSIGQLANYLEKVLNQQQRLVAYTRHELAVDTSIAIIGMSCRFPGGANNLEQFWDNLYQGLDAIGEVPKQRFDMNSYYDADTENTQKAHTKEFGFIEDMDSFDASFFGISPREAVLMDPQQRILLETSWHALENAGIEPKSLKGMRVGVFVGIQGSEYASFLVSKAPESFGAYQATGNSLSIAAGRIAYTLGTQGPTMSIDTACSSSLVALHEAARALRAGDCELAIVAGVNSIIDPHVLVNLSNAQMLSIDGRCKTFDAQANGYGRSEGCGVIVLQGTAQAMKQGARIWASVRASHINQDGASSGLTVPNGVAQTQLLEECLLQAGLTPGDIDYIECHGTGTSLGDPIEIGAITDVYAGRSHPLIVGTVKTNIGHLESAAGMAGIIKTVLAMNHQYIPRHLHFHELNPHINLEAIPAQIPVEGLPWEQRDHQPRRAGVSSFGFSGTNAHVILEEAPLIPERETMLLPEEHLFLLSAKSKKSLEDLIADYIDYLAATKDSLLDICYTAATGRGHFNWRLALKTKSKEGLIELLKHGEQHIQEIMPSDELLQSNDLKELSEAYSQGKSIDWVFYYAPYQNALRKVSLPLYVFDRQRYWTETRPARQNMVYGSRVHELLGTRLSGIDDVPFFNQIHLDDQSYLRGHQVLGFILMPGAAFMESALAAGRLIQGDFPVRVDEFTLQRPLRLLDTTPCRYEVRLKQNDLGYEGFIASHQEPGDWVNHSTFVLRSDINPSYAMVSLEALKEGKRQHDPNDLYTRFAETGFNYGPSFQVIQAAWVGNDELLAHLSVAQETNITDYLLHPTLLDGALQAIALLSSGMQNYIPASIEHLTCYRPLGATCWVRVFDFSEDPQQLRANLNLYDESGILVAELQGFSARATDKAFLTRLLSPEEPMVYLEHEDVYILPEWTKPREPVYWWASDDALLPNSALRFDMDAIDVGRHVVLLNPESFDALFLITQRLLRALPQSLTLVLPQGTPQVAMARGFWRSVRQEQGTRVPLYLIQGLSPHDAEPLIQCFVSNQLPEPEVMLRDGQYLVPRLYREEQLLVQTQRLAAPQEDQYLVTRTGIDGLHWVSRPKEQLGSTKVRVRLKATALNFRDVLHAMNLYPGNAGDLGYEAAGEVMEVGKEVRSIVPGARVVMIGAGLLACEAVLDEAQLVELPDGLSFIEGAALPIVYLTAHYALNTLAQLKRGQSVLIHAASGGVGLAAIALAQQLGVTIYATVSDPKRDYLRGLGIEHLYNSRSTEFGAQILKDTNGRGVDVVLNSLTSEGFIEASLLCLKPKGIFFEIGKRHIMSREEMQVLRQDVTYHIIDLGDCLREELQATCDDLRSLMAQCANGSLKILPIQEYPVQDTIKAMHVLRQAQHIGKIVITYPQAFVYKEEATYFISGGAGGLGLRLAAYLIAQGARHLVLIGRHPATGALHSWINARESAAISIRYEAIDITDKVALNQLIQSIEQSPYPLKGVFHAAGILHDGLLDNLTLEDLHQVLAPKVVGATYLDELTQALDLDCFVLFSSIATILGSPGQSNYAAANGYLDGLARARRARGLPALSINWGPFAEVGMAATLAHRHRAQGFTPLDTDKAFTIMQAHLNQDIAQISVLDMDWSKQTVIQPYLSHLVKQQAKYAGEWMRILSDIPNEQRKQVLMSHLKQLLAQVLCLKDASHVDINKRLFELGMDSLMTMELKNRLRDCLDHRIVLGTDFLFNNPTVQQLFEHLDAKIHVISPDKIIAPLGKRKRTNFLPVSFMQKYWLYRQIFSDLRTFMLTMGVELDGILDKTILEQAIHLLIQRHESLRTSFEYKNGDLLQVIHDNVPFQLSYKTIEEKEAKQKNKLIDKYVKESNGTVCDYKKGFLMDLVFVNVMDKSSVFILSIHHLCADALSVYIALNELQDIYNDLLANRQVNKEVALIQYADFSEWQHDFYTPENLVEHKKFWTGYLKDSKALVLPYDNACSEVDLEGELVTFMCDKLTKDQIAQFARAMGITDFIVCFMGFLIMSAAESQQNDMTLSVPQSGREFSELQNMIGFIASTCLVRHQLEADMPVQSALTALSQNFQKVLHYYLPYYNVSSFAANESMNLSYNILFEFLPNLHKESTLFGFPVIQRISPATVLGHDIIWCIAYDGDALSVSVSFNQKKYTKKTIRHFIKQWECVTALMIDDPTLPIGCLINYEKK